MLVGARPNIIEKTNNSLPLGEMPAGQRGNYAKNQ